jgi:hypothetical protein
MMSAGEAPPALILTANERWEVGALGGQADPVDPGPNEGDIAEAVRGVTECRNRCRQALGQVEIAQLVLRTVCQGKGSGKGADGGLCSSLLTLLDRGEHHLLQSYAFAKRASVKIGGTSEVGCSALPDSLPGLEVRSCRCAYFS